MIKSTRVRNYKINFVSEKELFMLFWRVTKCFSYFKLTDVYPVCVQNFVTFVSGD